MPDIIRRRLLQGTLGLSAFSAAAVIAPRVAMAVPAPEPTQSGFFPVHGGGAWYRMNGQHHFDRGLTPLVVIHGGPGLSHHYMLPIVEMAKHRPVIFYDQLDSGHSNRPGEPANWNVERFVSEVDDLREALGLSRLILLGNSWGGTIAAEYAMRQPAGLEALVLSGPLISTERWISDNKDYVDALPKDSQQTIEKNEAAEDYDDPAYQEAVMAFYQRHLNRQEPWPPALQRSFELFNTKLYQYMWGPSEFTATGNLENYDSSDRLSKIKAPTLYICGQYDESTPAANRDFARQTPNATVKVIADASHTPFLEQTSAYIAGVQSFLHEAL